LVIFRKDENMEFVVDLERATDAFWRGTSGASDRDCVLEECDKLQCEEVEFERWWMV
jgi:hypothetical protein